MSPERCLKLESYQGLLILVSLLVVVFVFGLKQIKC